MEDGQEDKSEKRISQEEHTPTEDSEYDDTMTERKMTEVSIHGLNDVQAFPYY